MAAYLAKKLSNKVQEDTIQCEVTSTPLVVLSLMKIVVFKCSFCVSSEFGNAWANENIFSVTEGIIWFRYHNYLASELKKKHPSWSDEELFQNARKKVIATFQVKQIVHNY